MSDEEVNDSVAMDDLAESSSESTGESSKPKKKASKKVAAKTATKKAPAKKSAPAAKPSGSAGIKANREIAALMKFGADTVRLTVIQILSDEGETNVGNLCKAVGQSQPAVSHHLALLRHAGVVEPRRDGKSNFYSLTDKGKALAKARNVLAS